MPAAQADLALALALELLSPAGLDALRAAIDAQADPGPLARGFVEAFDACRAAIGPTIAFLQGRDATLAHRIAGRAFLPEGPRFASLEAYVDPDAQDGGGDPMAWAFGALGVQDRARHLATLFLNDLADVIRDAVDPRFEFVRYAEQLAMSQASFDPLAAALGRAAEPRRRHPAAPGAAGAGRTCAAAGAGIGALPRARCMRAFASRRRSRPPTPPSSSCSAAATSTPSCANCPSRGSSTTSTT